MDRLKGSLPTCPPDSTTTLDSDCWVPHETTRGRNVSIKTLQRWRSEERGPPYIKLSKAVRYPVDEIVTYEQAIRQGMSNEAPLPSLTDAQPVVESPAPAAPEPKRYYLSEAFALIAQYGSLEAAEAGLTEARDETKG